MFKNKIEISELNKIYDEIYYSNFEDGDYGLDVITNLISQKEYEEPKLNIVTLEDIIDIITELYDELIDNLDNDGLSDISDYISDKKEKVLNREMDKTLLVEYGKFIDIHNEDEDFDDSIVEEVEIIEDEEYLEDDYDDFDEY